ncbi:flagellin N-terminal helical domain-containing protein [Butyrivibrio sp. MB2005]|uniref:flagellin N-terminal helical domain-containing protein n=1 Tax=Butyrivibrio sp. MB2005 TaxID=1280678 RepID=UPI000411FE66|nr:flagellin [Butyrivibrio sp. MB2005]
MQVNYNISAMIANNALVSNDNKLAASIERLSSGLKIANAKDNPSGLAISRRMNAQIKGLSVAGGNSGDGISVIQTADGTLSEVHDILQRMNELSIQAANGTNSESDLEIIQDEIGQLKDEITRISEATQFNGQSLLDGSFDLKGYATVNNRTDPAITVNSYSDFVDGGNYYFEGINAEYDEATGKVRLFEVEEIDNVKYPHYVDSLKVDVSRVITSQGGTETITYMSDADVTVDGDLIKVATRDGREIEVKVNRKLVGERIDFELTGKGAMTMQVGANEGQTLDIRVPKITLSNLGIQYTDVSRTYKNDLLDFVDYVNNVSNNILSFTEKNEIIDMTYYDIDKERIDEGKGEKNDIDYYFFNIEDARAIIEAKKEYREQTYTYDMAQEQKVRQINKDADDTIATYMTLPGATDTPMNPIVASLIDGVNEARDNQIADTMAYYDELRAAPMAAYNEKLDEIKAYADKRYKVAPHTGADQAIEDIKNAIQKVSDIRSRLGAYQNRLEHTVSNIDVTSENMTAAYSRIMDVDMAEEMTVYSTQQVLSQAGTTMLAQANERPSQVLQLLQ